MNDLHKDAARLIGILRDELTNQIFNAENDIYDETTPEQLEDMIALREECEDVIKRLTENGK
jgi:hypothetical protein